MVTTLPFTKNVYTWKAAYGVLGAGGLAKFALGALASWGYFFNIPGSVRIALYMFITFGISCGSIGSIRLKKLLLLRGTSRLNVGGAPGAPPGRTPESARGSALLPWLRCQVE